MRPRRLHEHEIDTILQQKRICSGFIATENLIYHGERAYYLDRPANYSKPCYPTFCYRCCRCCCCWSSFILRNHLYSYAVVFSFLSFFHSFIHSMLICLLSFNRMHQETELERTIYLKKYPNCSARGMPIHSLMWGYSSK